MADFALEQDETRLGKWTLNYNPPGGGRYTGPLTVTDRRLIFEARFDTSLMGTLEQALFVTTDSGHVLVIPKDRIRQVDIKKSFFSKNVLVVLDNDETHTFNYGMMSVDAIAEAIRKDRS